MDRDTFWKMIEDAKTNANGDTYVQAELLGDKLSQCSAEDILAFDKHFSELYAGTYGWELWGAAYVINGGCSDDSFDYFRGWLIAQGQDIFDKAVADPDSLADLDDLEEDDSFAGEDMLSLAYSAYKDVAGADLPPNSYRYPELGEDWDFDDENEMKSRYPRLVAKYYAD